MKTIKFFLIGLFSIIATNIVAQSHNHISVSNLQTVTFKVSGVCEICQAAIEKAAKSVGVAKAVWNKNTKILSISYNPAIVKVDDVKKKIAAIGYDTDKFKAPQKAYDSLLPCCKYER
ncbi:MAG: ATPase [Bacteroidetes bacterium HGW-Bacteroidetes-14]|jgi:copper chaperone CopZ|nr:MAG: ATPase [Bacteroidetes bacterium HGW-Bacteroidetes-14]